MDNGIELFKRAKEDRRFMTMYYNAIINSDHFKKVLNKGVRPTGKPRQQEFETEIMKTWNAYLIEVGRATPEEVGLGIKHTLIGRTFNILQEDSSIEFQIIDEDKNIGAVKNGKTFYEVKAVKHKKPQVNDLEVGTKLNKFIENLSEKLSEEYNLIRIKNNAITIVTDEDKQVSVTIVRKKRNLF